SIQQQASLSVAGQTTDTETDHSPPKTTPQELPDKINSLCLTSGHTACRLGSIMSVTGQPWMTKNHARPTPTDGEIAITGRAADRQN
ncbi:hypothetical protein BaRGS_00014139, partial [Batillaria attramentaria]